MDVAVFRARGDSGTVRRGYRIAARLGAWQFTAFQETLGLPTVHLRADIVGSVSWWFTQRPIDLELAVGRSLWSWQDAALDVVENQVQGTLTGHPVITIRGERGKEAIR